MFALYKNMFYYYSKHIWSGIFFIILFIVAS
jgi:hypothetical protein